jgi:YD repeat-containing protein
MARTVSGTQYTQLRTWNYSTTTELLTSKTAPESGTTSYTYNADNTLATAVDANNHEKKFTYDSYQRVTKIQRGTVSGGNFSADSTQQTTYTYDSSSTQNCGSLSNTLGHVAEIDYEGLTGTYTAAECYSYHAAGAPTKKTLYFNGKFKGNSRQGHI